MSFDHIVGQERSVTILQRAIAGGKTAHAYLFEGIDGCGRRAVALSFIQALFCAAGTGCGNCPSCRKMLSGNHPDLHQLEPDGAFIKIDQVRELQKELALRPYEASRKACLIEAADRMNVAAANAMLKTLEEPPGSAVMVLLTTDASAVLSTIRSRCQLLRFAPLSVDIVRDSLVRRGFTPEAAETAAGIARGSLGRALEVADADVADKRRELVTAVSAVSLADINGLFTLSERLSADKDDAAQALDTMVSFLRDVQTMLHGGDDIANRDLLPQIAGETERLTPPRVMARIASVMETRQALQYNANTRLALDQLFIRLART